MATWNWDGDIRIAGGQLVTSGTGSPEGVIAAAVGSLYLRVDGGTNHAIYIKESGGTGNTGWVAIGAAGNSIQLRTNDSVNTVQNVLNLTNGNGISITDNGDGSVSLAGVALKTNGTTNSSQTTLDLRPGSGINLNDIGSGRIQFSFVSPFAFQVNGTPTASQTTLNFKAGTNVTITDQGSGNLQFSASGGGGGGGSDFLVDVIESGTNITIDSSMKGKWISLTGENPTVNLTDTMDDGFYVWINPVPTSGLGHAFLSASTGVTVDGAEGPTLNQIELFYPYMIVSDGSVYRTTLTAPAFGSMSDSAQDGVFAGVFVGSNPDTTGFPTGSAAIERSQFDSSFPAALQAGGGHPTAGEQIVIVLATFSTDDPVVTSVVSDDGDTYTLVASSHTANDISYWAYYCESPTNGDSVTFSISGANAEQNCVSFVLSVSGLAASAFDQSSFARGTTSTSVASGNTGTTTQDLEFCLAIVAYLSTGSVSGGVTGTNGYTISNTGDGNFSHMHLSCGFKTAFSPDVQNATGTITSGPVSNTLTACLTFKIDETPGDDVPGNSTSQMFASKGDDNSDPNHQAFVEVDGKADDVPGNRTQVTISAVGAGGSQTAIIITPSDTDDGTATIQLTTPAGDLANSSYIYDGYLRAGLNTTPIQIPYLNDSHETHAVTFLGAGGGRTNASSPGLLQHPLVGIGLLDGSGDQTISLSSTIVNSGGLYLALATYTGTGPYTLPLTSEIDTGAHTVTFHGDADAQFSWMVVLYTNNT